MVCQSPALHPPEDHDRDSQPSLEGQGTVRTERHRRSGATSDWVSFNLTPDLSGQNVARGADGRTGPRPLLRMLFKIIPRQRLSPRPGWKSRTPPTASAPPPIHRPQQAKGPSPNIQNQLCNRRGADCHVDLERNTSLGAFQHRDVSFPALTDHRHEAVRLCIQTHFPAEGRRAPGAARLHCPTVCQISSNQSPIIPQCLTAETLCHPPPAPHRIVAFL